MIKRFQQAEKLRNQRQAALQARKIHQQLKSMAGRENLEKRNSFYNQELESTYLRIEKLEQKEKKMLESL